MDAIDLTEAGLEGLHLLAFGGESMLPIVDDEMGNIPERGWAFQPINGYLVRRIDDEHYMAIGRFMYTHAILKGRIDDLVGYSDRWCYHTPLAAVAAASVWDGSDGTEPEGWHRHPRSGRRRHLDADTGEIHEIVEP
jgi:hypothetical protein